VRVEGGHPQWCRGKDASGGTKPQRLNAAGDLFGAFDPALATSNRADSKYLPARNASQFGGFGHVRAGAFERDVVDSGSPRGQEKEMRCIAATRALRSLPFDVPRLSR